MFFHPWGVVSKRTWMQLHQEAAGGTTVAQAS